MNKIATQGKTVQINPKAYIMIFSLIAISIIFAILTNGIFLTPRNIAILARQTVVVGILAMGMMFVMVSGNIDLSVGSLLGFCGTLGAVLQVWRGWSTTSTIIAVIAIGLLAGMSQGFLVAYGKVPSFIITLGGLLVFRGVKLGVGKSTSIAPLNPNFSYFGQAYLSENISWLIAIAAIGMGIFFVLSKRSSRNKYHFKVVPLYVDMLKIIAIAVLSCISVIVLNNYRGIPVPVIILLIFAGVLTFLANKSSFGRGVYAIGGNIEAARLSGIKTKKITMYTFMISGMFAALAGIIHTARLDAATVAAGDSMELNAIAACIVGGTSLAGGVGRIPGVLIGALVMASLDNGMSLMNIENFWQFIVRGLVLVLAVWADTRQTS